MFGELVKLFMLSMWVLKLRYEGRLLLASKDRWTRLFGGDSSMCRRKEMHLLSIVFFRGKRPNSPRTRIFVVDLFIPSKCLQNDRCIFSICMEH